MLTVDINQQFTQFAQGLHVDRIAVDKCTRTAVVADTPAYYAVIIFIEFMRIEPERSCRDVACIESRGYICMITGLLDTVTVGTVTENQTQCAQ